MNSFEHRSLALLGLPAMPLAFVALPLYVIWPHYFASQFGVSLGLIGAVLLLARLTDALLDPALGLWVDSLMRRHSQTLLRRTWLAGALLSVGFLLLFFPHWLTGPTVTIELLILLVLGALLLSYLCYSFLNIALQSWGARLGGDVVMQSRLVGWREGLGLCGVILASLTPGWGGMPALVSFFVLLLALSLGAWWYAPRPLPAEIQPMTYEPQWRVLLRPWGHAGFRRLLWVFMLNGIASAIPATLMLFFVQDRLQLPSALQSQFLGAYFLSAAISMPLWLACITRFGLGRSWLAGMLLAVAVFVWTLGLGAGDEIAYTLVCLLSGLALGADLIAPGALLNGLLQQSPNDSQHSGAYFGWWQVATKLNLALAAGISLPLLQWLGYASGSRDAPALLALSWAYALLPCLLKLWAGFVLFFSAPHLQHKE
ncbi:MAG: MFS transporter [Betaproteobacteria bacterium]|nr:MFS transporter [Betaproteobacteria bacterium]